jgi:transcriptional regulator GlxA family with amidase domain
LQNLHDENFDTTALSNGMAMSRTQLFRKLKPILSQSAASYIKGIRLQKAKELLETSELSVSEVAYKTGFKTPSHFTKVLTEKFGIRPSAVSPSRAHVTNE